MVAGEKLEREERRAAAGRAVVLEAAPEELGLLREAELADRAVGERALAEVVVADRRLELLVDVAAQVGERALVRLGVRGGGFARGSTRDRRAAPTSEAGRLPGPTYWAEGRKSRPVRFSSRMCADQPATREQANMAGVRSGGISARSRTTAE